MKEEIIIQFKSSKCVMKPITAREYYNYFHESAHIQEDYGYYMQLDYNFEREFPNFSHPKLYAALKGLFGESNSIYDKYKCSFGFHFLLNIIQEDKESKYVLNFTDIGGGVNFIFLKVLSSSEDVDKYQKDTVYDPIENDFSKGDMRHLMTAFRSYLVGFSESFDEKYPKDFSRSLKYCCMIYGCKNGLFFINEYKDEYEFSDAYKKVSKNMDIPFNATKAYC